MTTTQELVERLRTFNIPACVEAADRLAEMDAENKRLRALCREAADFYGQGGVFPIDGVMSLRLGGAALEQQQKGEKL